MDNNDEKPVAQRISWFGGVERPTDTGGGTVFVKPPAPGSDSQEPAASQ